MGALQEEEAWSRSHPREMADLLAPSLMIDVPTLLEMHEKYTFGLLPITSSWMDKQQDVNGDAALLRLVFKNLFANALKYSRPRPTTTIEVGTAEAPGEVEIWVKDNGVGFEMKYVDKLFGVFQRLHTSEQFEGTGIGLAHVRRIIARHGGRTWAEGEVDQGATVHFTLPV